MEARRFVRTGYAIRLSRKAPATGSSGPTATISSTEAEDLHEKLKQLTDDVLMIRCPYDVRGTGKRLPARALHPSQRVSGGADLAPRCAREPAPVPERSGTRTGRLPSGTTCRRRSSRTTASATSRSSGGAWARLRRNTFTFTKNTTAPATSRRRSSSGRSRSRFLTSTTLSDTRCCSTSRGSSASRRESLSSSRCRRTACSRGAARRLPRSSCSPSSATTGSARAGGPRTCCQAAGACAGRPPVDARGQVVRLGRSRPRGSRVSPSQARTADADALKLVYHKYALPVDSTERRRPSAIRPSSVSFRDAWLSTASRPEIVEHRFVIDSNDAETVSMAKQFLHDVGSARAPEQAMIVINVEDGMVPPHELGRPSALAVRRVIADRLRQHRAAPRSQEAVSTPAIIVCTVNGACLDVMTTSLNAYVPRDVERYVHHKVGANFGDAYNFAAREAFKRHDEILVCNDDIVFTPTTWAVLLADVAHLRKAVPILATSRRARTTREASRTCAAGAAKSSSCATSRSSTSWRRRSSRRSARGFIATRGSISRRSTGFPTTCNART
jgi:hypothetical protein